MPAFATSLTRNEALTQFADSLPGKACLCIGATGLVAAAAHVSIPLPFTPVPLTLQPLAVLGVGLALGPISGMLTMLAYLIEGALGLPVFSPSGPGGVAQLLGPTGGFLMAYPAVAGIAGALTRLLVKRVSAFAAALVSGHAAMVLLFACGAGWFMHFTHNSLSATWIGSVAPFLPGEIVKVFVAAGAYSTLYPSRRIQ